MDDSIDSGNFYVRGYLPLLRKDSTTHMHDFAVYVKEGLPFARDLSLEVYFPLIRKDSTTHMHDFAVYVKEGLSFARDSFLENSADSYVFDWLYFT